VIDCATDTVIREIKAGSTPRGLAVSHDGKRLFVSDQAANALLVVDLGRNAVVDTVALGESPEGVAISPAGDWIVAASEITNAVTFISPSTGKKVFSVETQGKNPEHAEFSPDGKWLYVSAEEADTVDVVDVVKRLQVDSNGRDASVSVIDTADNKVVATIPVGTEGNTGPCLLL
jgi:YVTN family beta-propeller protein